MASLNIPVIIAMLAVYLFLMLTPIYFSRKYGSLGLLRQWGKCLRLLLFSSAIIFLVKPYGYEESIDKSSRYDGASLILNHVVTALLIFQVFVYPVAVFGIKRALSKEKRRSYLYNIIYPLMLFIAFYWVVATSIRR